MSLLAMMAAAAGAREARAELPTKQQCVGANEGAQTLRRVGKLRAARASARRCAVDACPMVVRVDCEAMARDLDAAIPTVVFEAEQDGAALLRVGVAVDGVHLTDVLDGSAVDVDPGDHTFTFDVTGHAPVRVVEHVVVGERRHVVRVEIVPSSADAPPDTIATSGSSRSQGSPPSVDATAVSLSAESNDKGNSLRLDFPASAYDEAKEEREATRRRNRALGFGGAVLGGLNLVTGAVAAFEWAKLHNDCEDDNRECPFFGGAAGLTFGGLIGGVALLGSGAYLLASPTREPAVAVRIRPNGLAIGGSL